ncbi:MAG TPA: hypothetical protein VMQ73_20640 [Methylomirabilota bacterium]|nr:hypothetical protein [Methylomirabilota bacterium]
MPGKSFVPTIDQLAGYMTDGASAVHVKLQYDEKDKKNQYGEKLFDYGVSIRVRKAGESDPYYTSLHFHVLQKQPKGNSKPQVSAHFKTGQASKAQQGWDLDAYDAYFLFLLLRALKPDDAAWKNMKVMVTEAMIEDAITGYDKDEIVGLKSICISKQHRKWNWEQAAKDRFEQWMFS